MIVLRAVISDTWGILVSRLLRLVQFDLPVRCSLIGRAMSSVIFYGNNFQREVVLVEADKRGQGKRTATNPTSGILVGRANLI